LSGRERLAFGGGKKRSFRRRRRFGIPAFHLVEFGLNGKEGLPDFVFGLLVGGGVEEG
jgi:hypothetical protein